VSGTPETTEPTGREEERLRPAPGPIGDGAGREEPAPRPARRTARWRRPGGVTGAVGAAAVCALLPALGPLGGPDPSGGPGPAGTGGDGAGEEHGRGRTDQEYIACARMIAEADVFAVRKAPRKGRALVTIGFRDRTRARRGTRRTRPHRPGPGARRRTVAGGPARARRALPAPGRAADTACPPHWEHPRD